MNKQVVGKADYKIVERTDGFECLVMLTPSLSPRARCKPKTYALTFNAVRSLVSQILAEERKHNNIVGVDGYTADEVERLKTENEKNLAIKSTRFLNEVASLQKELDRQKGVIDEAKALCNKVLKGYPYSIHAVGGQHVAKELNEKLCLQEGANQVANDGLKILEDKKP